MKPPRLFRSCAAALAVALLLSAAPRASADTLSLTFEGTTGAPQIAYTLNGNAGSATPGPYFWNANPVLPGTSNPISTYCIELTQGIPGGAINYTVNTNLANAPTIGTTVKANAIEALVGEMSNYSSSAFQLALWELVYDGATDLANPNDTNFFGDGSFKSSSSVTTDAQKLLHQVLSNINADIALFNTNYSTIEALSTGGDSSQAQLYFVPKPPKVITGTPAPPAVLLAAIGLLALGGRSRWSRLKAKTA